MSTLVACIGTAIVAVVAIVFTYLAWRTTKRMGHRFNPTTRGER